MTVQDAMARRGVVTAEADGRQRLEFHRSWPDPVEDVWSALTEPDRLARWIGNYQGERAAGDLAGRFPVSRPAISRHLRVLREAGLVRARTDGKRRLYVLDPRPLRELDDWLAPYRDLWAQRLDALDTEIARGRRAPRTGDHR